MFRTPVFIAKYTFVESLSPQNVNFAVKITPIHKVWSCSLGGQGVFLTGAGMFGMSVFFASSTC